MEMPAEPRLAKMGFPSGKRIMPVSVSIALNLWPAEMDRPTIGQSVEDVKKEPNDDSR
jgi:hypothetical protein